MNIINRFPELLSLQALARKKRLQVYLVGGFLRDRVLTPPKETGRDFDFAVSKNAIPLARQFAKIIKGAFVLLDKESGCARVAKKRSDGLWTYDFSDFRAKTLAKDLLKRDFTINTLHVDILSLKTGDSLEPFLALQKKPLSDIKAKIIRMASLEAFSDDPLRLLRAYSLKAQLGFKIDRPTLLSIKKYCHLIHQVSPERVREEFFKILESPRTVDTIKAIDSVGLLWEIMPQVKIMAQVKQGGYHHLDVWAHSLETIAQLEKILQENKNPQLEAYLNEEIAGGHSRKAILKFACLLHDTGKPDTKRKEPDGRTSFHGHEHVGGRIARVIARQFLMSTRETHSLEDMVTLHLRPGYLSNFKKPSDRMIFRFFRDARDEAVSILLLSLADQYATRGPLTTEYDVSHHEKITWPLIKEYFRKKSEVPCQPLINGHDLIKTLKLKPGPVFARILSKVEEAQHLGKVTTKKEALALARKISKG
ncbi:MAG: HD domain-containing protein [Candidatus Omnitrophica bacterium]|nr:HD domain-containing protein [Candidatus Omnitrophota bacterium]